MIKSSITRSNPGGIRIQGLLMSAVTSMVFLVMITFSIYAERKGYYSTHFRKFFLAEILAVILIVIIVGCEPHSHKRVSVDWFAMLFWASFVAYSLASDLLVDKKYRFTEIIVFIFLSILGLLWNRTDNKGRYIHDFGRAVQWFLLTLIILSILFPAERLLEGRFNGPITNPSVFALYLCSIWAVLLGVLESQMREGESIYKKCLTLSEMMVTIALMLLSQSLTPMIALAVVTFLFFFRMVARKKGMIIAIKAFLTIGVAIIIVFAVMVMLIRQADIGGSSRIIQKLQSADMSSFLSGRDIYWRRYFGEMNLFGHSKKPYLWDHRILPHNALVGMMYWYGVPCVVPYIVMMIMAIEKSYRFADTTVSHSPIPFYCIVSFVIMSMADNVEQPFVWLPWIACYMMMAPILVMPIGEIEALKGND